MKYSFASIALLGLLLAACVPTNTDSSVVPKVHSAGYEDYTSEVVGNGEQSVLFFHAAWCSMCKDKDKHLKEWYGEDSAMPVKTYKVDFDTEEDLKKKYRVGMQDTFVLIDGDGEVLKTEVAPNLSTLKRLLYLNIQDAKESEESKESEEMEKGEKEKEEVDEVSEGAEVTNKQESGDMRMEKEEVMEEENGKMKEEKAKEASEAKNGQYTVYNSGVIGNGEESVLFFHAAWCPACKANNQKLNDWYGSSDFSRSVYKIDFDTATDLRSKYRVTGQDTFILIDGAGNELRRVRFPSEGALKELLG